MKTDEKVALLREKMKKQGISMYIIPTADYHQSEYVGEYFKCRKFISGFTGSAGTAIVTEDEAYLWVDGRYFIQAAAQIKDTCFGFMKMGQPGVPTIDEYVKNNLKEGQILGFDGRVISMAEGVRYSKFASENGAKIICDLDLVGEIWADRPAMSKEPVMFLEEKYSGESVSSKLARIREYMKEEGANVHLLTTLDDICWTLNIRGNDIEFFPLILSYAIITMDKVFLYIDEEKLSEDIKATLSKDNMVLRPYTSVYDDIMQYGQGFSILYDPDKINFAVYNRISSKAAAVQKRNPEILMKAIKNETELENIKKAQIKDSVAHIRFMKWLKENYDKQEITEISASDKLDEIRASLGGFIRPSFEPISAYGEHGAMCHYSSTPETNVKLEAGKMLLTDTGAGFIEGSTDVTRTYALGEIPEEYKHDFTLVAVSNLSLASARFLKGCTGLNLDILARKPLWDRNLDFNHGTGHGVGYLLNIHEGPAGFRWRYRKNETEELTSGMVITDEPGLYIEGSHGIRLENELLVREGEKNSYGQFMYLETITLIPFDLDAILPEMLSETEKALINDYHKKVFDTIAPLLSADEQEWLARYTRAI